MGKLLRFESNLNSLSHSPADILDLSIGVHSLADITMHLCDNISSFINKSKLKPFLFSFGGLTGFFPYPLAMGIIVESTRVATLHLW